MYWGGRRPSRALRAMWRSTGKELACGRSSLQVCRHFLLSNCSAHLVHFLLSCNTASSKLLTKSRLDVWALKSYARTWNQLSHLLQTHCKTACLRL